MHANTEPLYISVYFSPVMSIIIVVFENSIAIYSNYGDDYVFGVHQFDAANKRFFVQLIGRVPPINSIFISQ